MRERGVRIRVPGGGKQWHHIRDHVPRKKWGFQTGKGPIPLREAGGEGDTKR